MSNVSIDASELKRLRLTVAISAKAKLWGVSEFAVADVVSRAMTTALLDETTGELKNFDASVFYPAWSTIRRRDTWSALMRSLK